MQRRRLLQMGALAPFWAGLATADPAAAATAVVGRRRVRPGEPGWPSDAAWRSLGERLSGRILRPEPLLGPCLADPKGADCKARLKDLQNPFFIGDQAAGAQVSGYLDAWTPSASAWAIEARTARDVSRAVSFARDHNLRLVVKGGGHSYFGNSNAPDSLLVWTRPMRAVTVLDAFVPKGAPAAQAPVPAVAAEAGALWIDLYDAVTTKGGRYVQGGGCTTVGVAGHVQSGGFGSFSKAFGTACAGLLEAELVTADGHIRTVNAHREPDLFWALKGGGGASFGVVTKVVLATHDLPATFGFVGGRIKASSDAAFARLITRFMTFYAERLFGPRWGEQVSIRPDNSLRISMVSQGLDEAKMRAIWAPFADWVTASPADYSWVSPLHMGADAAKTWWDVEGMRRDGSSAMRYDTRPGAPPTHGWWSGDQDQVGAFLHGYDSLWLPARLMAPDQMDGLVAALIAGSRHMALDLHFNKGLAGAPRGAIEAARDTAMNPDVVGAFALAIIATGGPPSYYAALGVKPDLALAHRNAAAVAAAAAELRRLAPDAGSYLSESSYFNADWRRAYWGDNHARLAGVKARYDPDGLFFTHHGVGSEAWSADGFERL